VLTRFCKRTGLRFPSPRHFTVYSENLYAEHKREIEEYWGCPARNRYGHGEGCVSAAECEAGSLHLSPEFGVVEFLRPDGSPAAPGEQARIVATGLHTHAMPFIRYDTGDLGSYSLAPCACGRTLPVLASVDGRADDMILGKDGRQVAALRAIFTHTHGIRLAQLVQERAGEVIVNLVPDAGFDASVTAQLASNLEANLGDALSVQFRIVDDVERSPSGKIRLVLSKLAKPA
jgi:phenylacetate-CoA ligase